MVAEKPRKKRRNPIKIFFKRLFTFAIILALLFVGVKVGGKYYTDYKEKKAIEKRLETAKTLQMPNYVTVDLIDIHNSARTGKKLDDVKNIVIHYVGNPATTAKNNRDYFNREETEVSSHFVVGLNGEIIQCVPIYEKSAATNWRNNDTISIEVCHPDSTGKFNKESYNSAVKLAAFLCNAFELDSEKVIRHYDVTKKLCPLYYVENPKAWKKFKSDVDGEIVKLLKN